MSAGELWMVVGMALVTFSVRYPILALISRITLPNVLLSALKFIPPAVLAAIIAPAILAPDGGPIRFTGDNAYLLGGVVAGVIAWRTRNLMATIVLGMLVFQLWRWWLSYSG